MPPVAADADAVHRPELVRLGVGGIHRRLSPVLDELAVRVELRHARAGIAVGHEERAVGQPGDVGRAVEVVRPPARHAALAHRLQELAVVAEDHDLVHVVVDDPDALFRVVRVHQDLVRPAAHLAESRAARRREVVVVLQPLLDRLAVAIDGEHQVVPALLVEVGLAGIVAPAGVRPAGVDQAGARPRARRPAAARSRRAARPRPCPGSRPRRPRPIPTSSRRARDRCRAAAAARGRPPRSRPCRPCGRAAGLVPSRRSRVPRRAQAAPAPGQQR